MVVIKPLFHAAESQVTASHCDRSMTSICPCVPWPYDRRCESFKRGAVVGNLDFSMRLISSCAGDSFSPETGIFVNCNKAMYWSFPSSNALLSNFVMACISLSLTPFDCGYLGLEMVIWIPQFFSKCQRFLLEIVKLSAITSSGNPCCAFMEFMAVITEPAVLSFKRWIQCTWNRNLQQISKALNSVQICLHRVSAMASEGLHGVTKAFFDFLSDTAEKQDTWRSFFQLKYTYTGPINESSCTGLAFTNTKVTFMYAV